MRAARGEATTELPGRDLRQKLFDEVVIALYISSGENSTLPRRMFANIRDQVDPLAMPAPEVAPEAAPDLSDLRAPQEAVAVATVAPVQPDTDQCKASTLQGLVGQPKAVLQTMLLPAGTRVIGPGDAVTMDFRPDRMNVEIGTDGRIAKIGCY